MSTLSMPRAWAVVAAVGLVMGACRDVPSPTASTGAPRAVVADARPDNPTPDSWGPIVTPSLRVTPPVRIAKALSSGGTLTPSSVTLTLAPGATATEHKVASLPAAPPKGDVVFVMDLTGSMGGELANMKVNSVNIMNAVAGVIPDVQFGVVTHEDYPAFYSSCGYSNTYGSGTDLPYKLDHALTGSTSTIATTINGLTLGSGNDAPESYSRALYELYAELTSAGASSYGPLGWRPGARRIAVTFNDDIPHDCNVGQVAGMSGVTTGKDPGRDGVVNTADDLELLTVIQGLKANNIAVIDLFSQPGFSFGVSVWKALADSTGGTSFVINPDGTIPGGANIATTIANLIQSSVSSVSTLTLGVCAGSAAYASWITGVSPASYSGVQLPATKDFDLTLGPPAGTPSGTYTFNVCAIGDGAELASQTVTINVVKTVTIDIKPGSFPNSVNLGEKGRLPVAILSAAGFDASTVAPATVTLGDELGSDTPVAARNNGTLFASLEDVNGDGLPDLVLHFSVPALVANGDLTATSTALVLRGMLKDGITAIRGTDSVRIVP